jgi:hypothetical protein
VSDLNSFIDTTRQFTAPPDGIPTPDRTQQVNVALEIAQRAAQQQPPTPMPAMPPITPVAN